MRVLVEPLEYDFEGLLEITRCGFLYLSFVFLSALKSENLVFFVCSFVFLVCSFDWEKNHFY